MNATEHELAALIERPGSRSTNTTRTMGNSASTIAALSATTVGAGALAFTCAHAAKRQASLAVDRAALKAFGKGKHRTASLALLRLLFCGSGEVVSVPSETASELFRLQSLRGPVDVRLAGGGGCSLGEAAAVVSWAFALERKGIRGTQLAASVRKLAAEEDRTEGDEGEEEDFGDDEEEDFGDDEEEDFGGALSLAVGPGALASGVAGMCGFTVDGRTRWSAGEDFDRASGLCAEVAETAKSFVVALVAELPWWAPARAWRSVITSSEGIVREVVDACLHHVPLRLGAKSAALRALLFRSDSPHAGDLEIGFLIEHAVLTSAREAGDVTFLEAFRRLAHVMGVDRTEAASLAREGASFAVRSELAEKGVIEGGWLRLRERELCLSEAVCPRPGVHLLATRSVHGARSAS